MVFAISNQVSIKYVEESTLGTTPGTPTLIEVRFTEEDLNFNVDFITSDEIRSDRMVPDTVQVAASADGSISGELSYASYDDWFEGALFSDWVTTATAEAAQTDISITKSAGTPNTWTLDSAALADFSDNNFVVGTWIKVEGFSTAGTFWAQITSIATLSLGIAPTTDIASEAAGDSVTVTPLEHLRNGTTRHSYTIQKAFTDLTTPEYNNFTGCVCDSLTMTIEAGSILNVEFGWIGTGAAMTETQFAGSSTTAANTNDVMNAVGNVAAIIFDQDAGAGTLYFQSLEIELDNNVRGQDAVGTLGFVGVVPGRMNLTGSIELYFEDSTLYDKFVAATSFNLSFMVADGSGNRYIVTVPRAKYTSMEIVAGGLDEDVFVSAEFEGIIDSTGTYQFQLSRGT